MTEKSSAVDRSNASLVAQIKKEMVNYIGPIFEELKYEIRGNTVEIQSVKKELHEVKEVLVSQRQKGQR